MHRNTTRFTNGSGVKISERRSSSTVSGSLARSWSGESRVNSCQNASPLSTTVSLVSSPPWLCPITTIFCSAGSSPFGSNSATARSSASRMTPAEYPIGFPLLYM